MSDLHSINEAINKKAGRKLLPSIGVGLSLIALVWFALSYQREVFAIVVAVAVILGLREIVGTSGCFPNKTPTMYPKVSLHPTKTINVITR